MKIKNKYVIGIVIILIIFGIFIGSSMFKKSEIKCGDSICSLTEDCNICVEDCECKSDEYCSGIGICRKGEVCRDEICSEQEKINNDCCEDCGCDEDKICNKITQKCQEKIIIGENVLNKVVQDYLTENFLTGTIKKITDSYHGQDIIKVVSIDCKVPEAEYPCEIVLFIDEKGKIIDEMRTT